jgi:hypothetical protein
MPHKVGLLRIKIVLQLDLEGLLQLSGPKLAAMTHLTQAMQQNA